MKVLISVDMGGICGVTSWVQVMPPEVDGHPRSTVEYERARARLTREVNAAVEGALEGGAEEVVVNEAHDGMRNLVADDLHESVRFITGSDQAVAQVRDWVGEQVVGAVVKEGLTTFPAIHLHPRAAQQRIREGAREAVARASGATPWRLAPDTRAEIDFDHQARAQAWLFIPGVERAGERTVAFTARDALVFNGLFRVVMKASAITFSP